MADTQREIQMPMQGIFWSGFDDELEKLAGGFFGRPAPGAMGRAGVIGSWLGMMGLLAQPMSGMDFGEFGRVNGMPSGQGVAQLLGLPEGIDPHNPKMNTPDEFAHAFVGNLHHGRGWQR
jgi:hypothetical protein